MSSVVEIYHLFHSGVAVKLADKLLIFDYYNDTPANDKRNLANGVIAKDLLEEEDNVFVFVTHSHHDHLNRVIFEWEEYNQNINYIVSSDVRLERNQNNYYQLKQYQSLELSDLNIESYGTTDQGLSYYIETNGINIFHSGDLNWWHWNKFSPEERKVEERDFKAEVERFKDKEIDIAFVPVDPRLEEHYYLAGEYFAKTVQPKLLVPIHFSNNYYITKDFAKKINGLDTKSAAITKRGEKIKFSR